jgi:hypothetical protein
MSTDKSECVFPSSLFNLAWVKIDGAKIILFFSCFVRFVFCMHNVAQLRVSAGGGGSSNAFLQKKKHFLTGAWQSDKSKARREERKKTPPARGRGGRERERERKRERERV